MFLFYNYDDTQEQITMRVCAY